MQRLPVAFALFLPTACQCAREGLRQLGAVMRQADINPAKWLLPETAKKLEAGFIRIAEATCGLITGGAPPDPTDRSAGSWSTSPRPHTLRTRGECGHVAAGLRLEWGARRDWRFADQAVTWFPPPAVASRRAP